MIAAQQRLARRQRIRFVNIRRVQVLARVLHGVGRHEVQRFRAYQTRKSNRFFSAADVDRAKHLVREHQVHRGAVMHDDIGAIGQVAEGRFAQAEAGLFEIAQNRHHAQVELRVRMAVTFEVLSQFLQTRGFGAGAD